MARMMAGEPFWPRDVDRFASLDTLDVIADHLDVDSRMLVGATLHRYEGTLFPRLTLSGWLPWVMPVGVFHRTHRHRGHAFCPRCLGEGRPLRISGRIAFEVACTRHQCALLDACPYCDAPITFSRMSLAQTGRYRCAVCGGNLAAALSRPLNALAKAFEHRCHRVLRQGMTPLAGEMIPTSTYFAGTRVLLRGLYPRARLNGVTDSAVRRSLRWPRDQARPTTPFEHWRLADRMRALGALEHYLHDWPDAFLQDAARSRAYRCRFDDGRIPPPAWVAVVLDQVAPSRIGSVVARRP